MTVRMLTGDCREVLKTLPDASVHCVVTSPPYYGLRSYLPEGHPDKHLELGSEPTPGAYIATMVEVFREVRRVLRPDGVCWLNLGDSYASSRCGPQGLLGEMANRSIAQQRVMRATDGNHVARPGAKPKDLLMMPARVALALQADGWFLRSQLPWIKRSCMPESTTDRPTNAIEYVFLLTKKPKYFWDAKAVAQQGAIEAGVKAAKGSSDRSELKDVNGRPPEYWEYTGERNFRNSDLFFDSLDAPHGLICDADGEPIALDVNTASFPSAHYATFPPKLIEPLIKAGTSERGCCAKCGASWVRQVEREMQPQAYDAKKYDAADPAFRTKRNMGARYQAQLDANPTRTTGWTASCYCRVLYTPGATRGEVGTAPCVVLDPFGGSGTVGLVCDRLGRDAVLIDLNPGYAAMARDRIVGDAPLFAEVAAE